MEYLVCKHDSSVTEINVRRSSQTARAMVEAVALWTWEISHEACLFVLDKHQTSCLLVTNLNSDYIVAVFIPVRLDIATLKSKVEVTRTRCGPTQQEKTYCLNDQTASSMPPIHHSPMSRLSPQIVAAILAIAGIVMMTYADGFHSHSVIGITLVVASASMSALYKVFVTIPYENASLTGPMLRYDAVSHSETCL